MKRDIELLEDEKRRNILLDSEYKKIKKAYAALKRGNEGEVNKVNEMEILKESLEK